MNNPLRRAAPRAALAAVTASMLALAGCAAPGARPTGAQAPRGDAPAAQGAARRGGYYLDDGPGSAAPNVDAIADAVPRAEPLLARANRPYVVFERQYTPMTALAPFRERGVGTWYGRKYHGQRTSSGEVYDMYAMTGAHPTLPIPSYARVTNLRNGRSVVVRVNDRGPFLHGRVVDLSYTAAAKLGYAASGSTDVEVELITNFDRAPGEAGASGAAAVSAAASLAAASPATALPDADAPVERLAVETVVAGASGADRPAGGAGGVAVESAAVAAQGPGSQFLQLAAFTSRENAEASRARLARDLDWLADRLQVRQEGALFKVHAGPYPGRDEALAAADRIRQATAFRPFPVSR